MVTVIPYFDLAQTIGATQVELEASTVDELMDKAAAAYGDVFRRAATRAAIVVNGRNVSLLKGGKTPLRDGDQVWLVLPSGGG